MIVRNINNYGIKNLLIMFFYEIIYCFDSRYRSQVFYDESVTNKYDEIKNKTGLRKNNTRTYNAPYSPTPIYFLILIKDFLKNFNTKNYYFIDFGCGAGRSILFFKNLFKKKLGIDFNQEYKKFFKNKNFISLNLRNSNSIKLIKKKYKFNNYILYFYEPFDETLIMNIIKNFLPKKLIIILINVKKIKLSNLKLTFSKEFKNHSKNIRIYQN